MALELRPNCEYCDVDLPPDSTAARICTYECTFCAECVTSGIDLALWLVEREGSPAVAARIADRMEYTPFRPSSSPA